MKLRQFFLVMLLCTGFPMSLFVSPVMAAVTSTTKPTGGENSIYVAGNPDWYPVEYYNPKNQCYEGVLPELLKNQQKNRA